jgi:hypothetical protein
VRSRALGSRDAEAARIFMRDVASRLTNRVQLTSDGHNTYLRAVWEAFRSPNRPPPSLSRNTGRHRNRQAAIAPRNASAQRRSGGLALQTRITSAHRTWSVRTARCGCIYGGSRA